ncbi:hypothetical protein VTK73DRAFT_3318 [Phialemonium thermophilum]|uniref:Zn(2)-C6 fungal-type domain-containing protein n=1 Tax=Phialemonium thermophilum TaxID=223376 RepID=A0ABR3Y2L0_9PEZI
MPTAVEDGQPAAAPSVSPPGPEHSSQRSDGDAADSTTAKAPPRKRRRTVISCTECHRRKQKCDRQLPCYNCVLRNKQALCQYDMGAPTMKMQQQAYGSRNGGAGGSPSSLEEDEQLGSIPTKVADFGYSQTGASTLGFLRKIEGANPSEPLSRLARGDVAGNGGGGGGGGDNQPNMRDRYKSLIRQLPARTFVDRLVDVYFTRVNWQYFALDRDVFDHQLASWHALPFSLLTQGGPQALPPELRPFPALLFQVLAIALLQLPSEFEQTFESLKYAGSMTFEDLAMDYSESGVAILSLLGKRQMSLNTVLADFLRASFLKYGAMVTEAWHAIGVAIRDAQEIGLHRDSLDPKPASDDAEAVLENQWEIQRRRRLWMLLVSWDVHTGAVLGRPTTISLGITPPTLPVDTPTPKDRSRTPVLPRGPDDPPTPLTRSIWAYRIMSMLPEILDLEKDGPCPKDFSKVDSLHERLVGIEEQIPGYFRLENPDKRFDALPECFWLKYTRASLPQLWFFNLMALHRPYIFTRPKSRTAALKASLAMLNTQRLHFQSLEPSQYKTFSLFFGTFDAIVLVASIYILFPKEHRDLVHNAKQHFQWALERFQAMSTRNALARAALGVLQAIYIRLKRSLGCCVAPKQGQVSASVNPSSEALTGCTDSTTLVGDDPPIAAAQDDSPHQSRTGAFTESNGNSDTAGASTVGSVSSAFTPTVESNSSLDQQRYEQQQQQQQQQHQHTTSPLDTDFQPHDGGDGAADWLASLPPDFDWSAVQPIFATSDLIYNELVGVPDDSGGQASSSSMAPPTAAPAQLEQQPWGGGVAGTTSPGGVGFADGDAAGGSEQVWQFDGYFGNDSVWSLLNHYTPH